MFNGKDLRGGNMARISMGRRARGIRSMVISCRARKTRRGAIYGEGLFGFRAAVCVQADAACEQRDRDSRALDPGNPSRGMEFQVLDDSDSAYAHLGDAISRVGL